MKKAPNGFLRYGHCGSTDKKQKSARIPGGIKKEGKPVDYNCKQLKLKAKDAKYYNTDIVEEKDLNTLIARL